MKLKKWLAKHPGLYHWFSRRWHRLRRFGRGMARLAKHGAYTNRNFLIDDVQRVIFVANAKVASTSIKASMSGITATTDNYRSVTRAVAHQDNYLANIDLADYPGYYTFAFVRDPLKRLLSCYQNKYHTDKALLGMAKNGLYKKDMFFDDYLLGFLAKDRGFLRFAARTCLIPDCLAERHFVGQDFILHDKRGNSLAQYVGKMEDLPGAYEPIRERFGYQPLEHHNNTASGSGASKPKNWMDEYDLKTARKVIKRYKRDIEAFGYQESADRLIDYLTKKEKP